MTLLEAKLGLLKLEIREGLETLARQGLLMVLGGVIASVGVAMLGLSLGFVVSTLLPAHLGEPTRYATGFAAVALVSLLAGSLLAWRSYRKLRESSIHPARSLKEMESDRRWIARQKVS